MHGLSQITFALGGCVLGGGERGGFKASVKRRSVQLLWIWNPLKLYKHPKKGEKKHPRKGLGFQDLGEEEVGTITWDFLGFPKWWNPTKLV